MVLEDQGSWCVSLSLCCRSTSVPSGPRSRVSKAAGGQGMFSKAALLIPLVMEARVAEAVSFGLSQPSTSVSASEGFSHGGSPGWWLVSSWVWVCSQGPGLLGQGAELCGLPVGRASTRRSRGMTPRSTKGSQSAARRSGQCSACCWWRSPPACSPCCCTRRSAGKERGGSGRGARPEAQSQALASSS